MLRQTVKSLPRTLHATYERMLSNIHEDYTDIVVAALKWLVISHEKQTIHELAEAVAAGIDSKSSFNIDNRFRNSDELLDILGSLAILDTDYSGPRVYDDPRETPTTDRKYVQLSHFSVREYLTSTFLNVTYMKGFDEPSLHLFALECCLNYINWLAAQNNHEILWKYPFLHWPSHARSCSNQNDMETARYIVQFLDSCHWRKAWFGQQACNDSFDLNYSNIKWENGNDPDTTIYYASFLELEHVERLLVDEYNATVDVPLELGECPPVSVAAYFENVTHVRHFFNICGDGYTEYDICRIALELAIEKGGSFLLMVLIEIIRLAGRSVCMQNSTILDFLQLITNKCNLIPRDDGYFWWKPFSYALLYPDQETSAFVVRSEFKIQSEWPLKLGSFLYGIEEVLLAIAISIDSMERFQLIFYHIQSLGFVNYRLFSFLAAFARCDKEAKLRFVLERAEPPTLIEAFIFPEIMHETFTRKDEVVLKLLLSIGMHPDLLYCDPWSRKTDSTKSPLQQAVYRRWRAGVSLLIKGGADVKYRANDLVGIGNFTRCSLLSILMMGIEDPAILPGLNVDGNKNDRSIEELLMSGGAIRCRNERFSYSRWF